MDFREITEFLKDSIVYILIIIVVILIFTFGFSFQKVVGDSMASTYENNDILVLSKIGARLFKISKNDVIAFNASSGAIYIKRVIATAGDTVYAKDNQVYVNDVALDEEYLDRGTETDDFTFKSICNVNGCEDGVIPDDYYFVLGDNRKDSIDSRFRVVGLVKKEDIIGKVKFKIFPFF